MFQQARFLSIRTAYRFRLSSFSSLKDWLAVVVKLKRVFPRLKEGVKKRRLGFGHQSVLALARTSSDSTILAIASGDDAPTLVAFVPSVPAKVGASRCCA